MSIDTNEMQVFESIADRTGAFGRHWMERILVRKRGDLPDQFVQINYSEDSDGRSVRTVKMVDDVYDASTSGEFPDGQFEPLAAELGLEIREIEAFSVVRTLPGNVTASGQNQ